MKKVLELAEEWLNTRAKAEELRKELKKAILEDKGLPPDEGVIFLEHTTCSDSPTGFHVELDVALDPFPACVYCGSMT